MKRNVFQLVNAILFTVVFSFLITLNTANTQGYFYKEVPIADVADKDKISFAMYTVHNNIMKMMVQLYPLADEDSRLVYLEIKDGNKWKRILEETVRENEYGLYNAKAWNLQFRVENWDQTKDWPYRVVALDGKASYEGLIRHDPIEKEEIVVAAFTGNSRWDQGPRQDLVDAIKFQDPDLLFFSGDQVYHHTCHLAEWLIFGRDFGEIIKDRPTVSLPDDHDVGQGNLWGSSGKKAERIGGPDGGYLQTPQYVREVEFAQTANLPDPYDPTPVQRGISVYYTSLNVGGIDFAIIEDRKFKTSPLEAHPWLNRYKRPDHPPLGSDLDSLDAPDASLLGQRQLNFLNQWGTDWQDAQMKCVLSATIFCHATTTGYPDRNIKGWIDMDVNGWPQTGRNKALNTIRKSYAFMLAGDQHLGTVVQHGIDEFGDAGYSFSVPSIVNHHPRRWEPPYPAERSIEGPLEHLGDYYEELGNRITMYAHANPDAFEQPIETLHPRTKMATGHGIVRFNKVNRTITMECWPRGMDPQDPEAQQYPGWPFTIEQTDNYGREAKAYLPALKMVGEMDPVVQVIKAKNKEVIYTLRIKGKEFQPKVFAKGKYDVIIGEGENRKTLRSIKARKNGKQKVIEVTLQMQKYDKSTGKHIKRLAE